ncbi:lipid A deacylase LpxR family protein [Acidisoma silvae]|uniref:Lipid A deacylase LpxR family protein n=1 Tax=Acidisoma silvae TaxID=2802396 RepID=A0A963YQ16_9PROT|nr:lipid A deacylase LpxR family protein [Acidisoma silvae]MCB8874509.1 lipid A deacylase LpxR family protein [Acidisoma silvae]
MPPADNGSIYTIRVENDATGATDENYTSGLQIGWTGPTGDLPGFLANGGHAILGAGNQRVSIDLSQQMYTPSDTQLNPPDPNDRPYAATLLLTGQLIQDTATSRTRIGVQAGVLGPDAGGEIVQNGFHTIIGDDKNQGWDYQLDNRPELNFFADRTWRVPLFALAALPALNAAPIGVDILPDVTGFIGTEQIYAQAGGILRIGQGLEDDFGAGRIMPGIDGSDAYLPDSGLAWYLFGGVDGQAVAYNTLLEGNAFADGPSVTKKPFVAEFEVGVAMIWHGVRLSLSQTWQTHEFTSQQGGLFDFGSVAVSARF